MKKYNIYVQRAGAYIVFADRMDICSYSIFFYEKDKLISVFPTSITIITTIEDLKEDAG